MARDPEVKLPAALERYRVSPENPTRRARTTKQSLQGDREPFVRDVRRALRSLQSAALRAARDPSDAPAALRISVKAVAQAAGKGRSQIYNAYPYLVAEIRASMQRVKAAAEEARKRVPKTKDALNGELRAVRRAAKIQVRTIASTQLADLIERLGPEHRRREKDAATIAELRRRLREAEQVKLTLGEINKGLMIGANRRG